MPIELSLRQYIQTYVSTCTYIQMSNLTCQSSKLIVCFSGSVANLWTISTHIGKKSVKKVTKFEKGDLSPIYVCMHIDVLRHISPYVRSEIQTCVDILIVVYTDASSQSRQRLTSSTSKSLHTLKPFCPHRVYYHFV